MKYFIDTEFRETPNTIDLISIGIKCEDGRELYYLNKDVNLKKVWKDIWLRNNVLAKIYNEYLDEYIISGSPFSYSTMKRIFKIFGKSKKNLNILIRQFVYSPALEYEGFDGIDAAIEDYFADGNKIEFYGYYADYDWVVFCWIFGRMINLPKGFPMYCKDLKQMMDDIGLDYDWKKINCPEPHGIHSAIEDAKWNYELYKKIKIAGLNQKIDYIMET